MSLHTTHTRWLVHSWSTFGARTSHGQHGHTRLTMARTWGKPPPSPYSILWTSPRGPHPNGFSLPGLPRLWSPVTLQADFGSKCGLKQSCSSRRELSNDMWQVVCSQVNWVDSQLFLVGSQTGSLTPGPSFGHNLCFKCPNEQCEPILDIYVPRYFQ
jgi:hypothetical protein